MSLCVVVVVDRAWRTRSSHRHADQIVRIEMLLGRRMWLCFGINSYVASTEASDLFWI